MADHLITKEYNESLRQLETADPGHAGVFNPLFERLINNDAHIKAAHDEHLAENEQQFTKVLKVAGYPNKWERIAYDNFAGITNFEFIDRYGVTNTDWTVADNKISSVIGTTNIIAWYKNIKLNDGTIRVVYENPYITSVNYVGLAFRRQDSSNFSAVLLWDGTPGKVELWRCVAGTLSKIGDSIELSTLDVANEINIPKSLEVEVIGNRVKIYVNNKLILTSTDSSINDNAYGECGIITYNTKVSTFSSFSIAKKKFDIINPSISKLLCSGTSITGGVGATTPYPTLLRNKLREGFCGSELVLVNAGHSGKNTEYILSCLVTELTTHNPDIVILEGNINDTSLTVGLTPEETINNLRKMIKLCKQQGAIPILTTSTHTNPILNTATWNKTSFDKQVLNNIRFRQLAFEEDIRIADVSSAFSNDFTLLNDDIHPNDIGAELMAQTIYETIVLNK